MRMNNKGFIAISLIYSFFLVFLIMLLAIVSDYAHNRVLLNDVKKETQNYLNDLAEFNPVYIENRDYAIGESIVFGSDSWQVIEDDGTNVTLLLNRGLTSEEITSSLTNLGLTNASQGDRTLMCLNRYNAFLCNYESAIAYNYYTWSSSVVKKILDDWFYLNAPLQKAIYVGNMQLMNYSDNLGNYSTYVRIPLASEFAIINDLDIWYLTSDLRTNGISYIKYGGTRISTHNYYKKIKPVIKIQKSI